MTVRLPHPAPRRGPLARSHTILPADRDARYVRLTVPAVMDGALEIRETARTFARRHLVARPDEVALAVWEGCVNAMKHAYREVPDGHIDFTAARRAADVQLTIADRGSGLRPRVEESGGLGAGLIVMATLADALEIATSAHGTSIVLRFRCGVRR